MNGLVRIQTDKLWQDFGIDGQQSLNVLFAVGEIEVVAAEAENAALAQLLDEVAFQQPAGVVGRVADEQEAPARVAGALQPARGVQLLEQGIESAQQLLAPLGQSGGHVEPTHLADHGVGRRQGDGIAAEGAGEEDVLHAAHVLAAAHYGGDGEAVGHPLAEGGQIRGHPEQGLGAS